MKKWEYKVIRFEGSPPEYSDRDDDDDEGDEDPGKDDPEPEPSWQEELSQHGRKGWELVSVIHHGDTIFTVVAFLKREIGGN